MLQKAGYHVTVVASVPDVIESLLKVGKPSLVIVDASLSQNATNRDGCELVEKMSGIPIVCISAYLDREEVNRLGLMGRFVDKNNFDKKAFLNLVKESISHADSVAVVLARRTVFAGQILGVFFAFLAGFLIVLSKRHHTFWGMGRGYLSGLGMCSTALAIECLLCLRFLSYYYELRPLRRKHGEEKSNQKS